MKKNIVKVIAVLLMFVAIISAFACENIDTPESDGEKETMLFETANKTESNSESYSEEHTPSETETTVNTHTENTGGFETETVIFTETDTESNFETVTNCKPNTETEINTESESVTITNSESKTEIESKTETETDTDTGESTEAIPRCEGPCKFKSVNGKPTCTVCGYVAQCQGIHDYTASPDGHWKPACEYCGKGEGRVQMHEIEEKVEDEGDLRLYYGKCSICGYIAYEKEVEYSIRAYIGTSKLLNANSQGFVSSEAKFEDGISFARLTTGNTKNNYVLAVENEGEDRTTGEYLVLKMRLNNSLSDIKLSFSTFASYNADTDRVDDRGEADFALKNLPAGWLVLIIDMKNAVDDAGRGYVADAGGEYYLKNLKIAIVDDSANTADKTVDISYIMLCNTLAEAESFVSEEKGYYLFSDISSNGGPTSSGNVCNHKYTFDGLSHTMNDCDACGVIGTAEGHVIGEHAYDGIYRYECICGYIAKEKSIPDGVNIFISPNSMMNEASGHVAFSNSSLIYSEDGDAFVRIWGKSKTDDGRDVTDSVKWYNPLKDNSIVSGNYMVIKLRIGENGLGQTYLKMYTSTKNKDATDERDGLTISVSEDGKWHVIVIDLSTVVGNNQGTTYVKDKDGTYTAKFLQIRPFSGMIAGEDDYMDIAYVAFADNVESLLGLVSEDMYYFMSDKGSGGLLNTDGSCVTHGFAETKQGNTYTYSCSSCGYEIGNKTVADDVSKFYGVNEVSDSLIDTYQILSRAKLYDDESQIAFTRFLTATDVIQPAYSRNDREGQSRPESVGKAEYLVVTVRQSKISSLAIALGTSAYGESTFNGANIPIISLPENEWVTFVIDIKSVYGNAAWVVDEDGNYMLTHFEITCYLSGEGHLDIASYAFCDGWDQIKTVVDTETVQFMMSNNISETRAIDGSVIENAEE